MSNPITRIEIEDTLYNQFMKEEGYKYHKDQLEAQYNMWLDSKQLEYWEDMGLL